MFQRDRYTTNQMGFYPKILVLFLEILNGYLEGLATLRIIPVSGFYEK